MPKNIQNQFYLKFSIILFFALPLSVVIVRNAPTYTEVGGPIFFDTTWSLANSPYIVVDTVEVLPDVTLIIEPGAIVRFNDGRQLLIDGQLIARGTVNDPVVFTSNQASPTRGYWSDIEFAGTAVSTTFDINGNYVSGSVLQYCVVEYGGKNVYNTIQAYSLMVDNCVVRYNAARSIKVDFGVNSPGRISNNLVFSNTGDIGILILGGVATRNTIIGNTSTALGAGILANYSTVSENYVSGNIARDEGGGIYASDSIVVSNTVVANTAKRGGGIFSLNSVVTNNTIGDNIAKEQGGGIYALGGSINGNFVYGNSVVEPSVSGSEGGGIWSNNSAVNSNRVVDNFANDRGGGIFAYLSTVSSNTIAGNSANYFGGGIYADSSATLTNTIANNYVVENDSNGAGVYINGDGDFLYNTVVGNHGGVGSPIGGLAINGMPQIHFNNLYGNQTHDIVVVSSTDVSGTNNYWGTSTSFDITRHTYDWYDDNTRGKLLFFPYLLDPLPASPVAPPLNLTATVSGDNLVLSWEPLPQSAVVWNYQIYYDSDNCMPPYTGTGLSAGISPISVGTYLSYTLSGFDTSKTYYIAVTASDPDGHESWYSNLVEKPSHALIFLPVIQR